MNEKVKFYLERIKGTIGGLSGKRKKQIVVMTLLILVISIGTAAFLNAKSYNMLFTGLNEQEASEIMGKLQSKGVSYKYEDGGTILVDAKEEEKIKAELVYEGYPKSGFTYDVFKSNIDLMTTDFEKNNYKLFDLQDRIGATIRLFDGVKDAKVTIALGEDRRYVLDANEKTQASASVVVIMNAGGSPTPEQVKGIQRLVAKSIPQLDIANVAVLDGDGNDVSQADSLQSELAKLKADFETQIENSVKSKVINVLAPFYGEENIRVSVKATVDMNKKIRESINYSLPKETVNDSEEKQTPKTAGETTQEADDQGDVKPKEGQDKIERPTPIKSRESINQEITRDKEQVGGVAGTESNADIPIYGGNLPINGKEAHIVNQNDIDYLVNQIKEQTQIDSGIVEDMMISVSLNTSSNPGIAKEEVISLVGNASGIAREKQASKITVVSGAFYDPKADEVVPGETPSVTEQYKIWIIGAAGAFIFALLVTIIVSIILRKKRKKKQASMQVASPRAQVLAVDPAQDEESEIISVKNEKTLELRNNIRDFATDNPEISAQLLRSWLRGEGEDE
ncbi:MAG: flagellar basal-body MS-ring/collar protein FliF [Peptostreptococcaceae bacterium]|nr:flagellar basal-body MS-ring/collar protein FliF [Peptostreptococcaceae bacterium]